MKQTIWSVSISLALSAAIYFGSGPLAQFAFYVLVGFNVLAWLGLLGGMIKDDTAERIRKTAWLNGPSSAIQITAVVLSGHPILGASEFFASLLIVLVAFKAKQETA